ncbi:MULTISPECIES: GNAT family N-acetyltransferase [Cupriavidus]|jgi:GNAT superfamily N-acetyltransferase|uniref:GNAT family N-acetyltransferase n=1 Tax=Cupriavidus metallidurans TaxID=119219 RepID=A0A2L0X1H5_9BURK|nr:MULTISPECIES: GNAT family N-acetyltransferase [Cupriavidus]AVA33956.1 N-acetyltransferase [Cupriavidus metallidurans]KWR84024.1 GNAT family acetyltransferase [Cupriavidus sp. SHE]QBP12737.1 GNAT family N-acetyltransferase [Cupriavidus metallidurans]QWC90522.1 GNAT family N-acetyltransferase [Cupriavidus metallidurans]
MSRVEDDNQVATPISEENWTGRSGARLTLRPARGADQAALRMFVDSLSRESRYFRFLTGGRVTDEIVQGFVSHRKARDVALVVTYREADGAETIVANAEYVVNEEDVAELAVVVADAWQGQGLGRRLIQRLQQLAGSGQLRGMRGDVLSENRRMLAIMRDCGFSARRNPEDSFLHEVSLTLAEARASAREHRMPRDWFAAH